MRFNPHTPDFDHEEPSTIAVNRITGLRDSSGRVINNLRISITDRCNFRCTDCMPADGMTWLRRSELLTYEEITRLACVFASLGISRIRLTGGEPLLRRDLSTLIRSLVQVKGIGDLALTTNGYHLVSQGRSLYEAGLRRINVSLDSLDPTVFSAMTRRDYHDRVWAGVECALSEGMNPVKLNVVLLRGLNEAEIPKFVELARVKSLIVRFIEFVPLGLDDGWDRGKVVPTREVLETIERTTSRKLVPIEYHGGQPADRYIFEDGIGEIGFISSISEPFCDHCNRVRITSDGKLRTCLFSQNETDLKSLLRRGENDEAVRQVIMRAVWDKEPGHLVNSAVFTRPQRTMSQIGG